MVRVRNLGLSWAAGVGPRRCMVRSHGAAVRLRGGGHFDPPYFSSAKIIVRLCYIASTVAFEHFWLHDFCEESFPNANRKSRIEIKTRAHHRRINLAFSAEVLCNSHKKDTAVNEGQVASSSTY